MEAQVLSTWSRLGMAVQRDWLERDGGYLTKAQL